MNITVIGKGRIGGGLADKWERAGHTVQRLGREGGDASGADVVLVAVPGGAVAEALAGVTGLEGKTAIDATNVFGERAGGFESNAHLVKSVTGAPTAKSFNANFATAFGEVERQRVKPGNFYAADDEAREVVEQLILDAGYDPIPVGNLDMARALEDTLPFLFAVAKELGGPPIFYRYAKPGEL